MDEDVLDCISIDRRGKGLPENDDPVILCPFQRFGKGQENFRLSRYLRSGSSQRIRGVNAHNGESRSGNEAVIGEWVGKGKQDVTTVKKGDATWFYPLLFAAPHILVRTVSVDSSAQRGTQTNSPAIVRPFAN